MTRSYVFACFVMLLSCSLAEAEDRVSTGDSGGPYCGINCVFAVARMLDVEVKYEHFLDPQFVAEDGSSFSQLMLAARSVGLKAKAYTHLGYEDVLSTTTPLILFVRSAGTSDKDSPDHFIVAIGSKDGSVVAIDGQSPLQRLAAAALLERWDGSAIAVSQTEMRLDSVGSAGRRRTTKLLFFAFGLAVLLRYSQRLVLRIPCGPSGVLVAQASAIVVVGIIVGLTSSIAFANGSIAVLLASAGSDQQHIETAPAQPAPVFSPISLEDLRKAIAHHEVLVIDARLPVFYDSGHIDGAINISAGASRGSVRDVLRGAGGNDPMVVYCESEACSLAEMVANNLYSLGYTNVRIFHGGWSEWVAHEKR